VTRKQSGGNSVFAIIKSGGHQYRVAPGDTIDVEKVEGNVGDIVELGEVLLLGTNDGVQVGSPLVEGARVTAKVVAQRKGEKLVVFKFKAKKRYRRKTGHRQSLTRLSITEIAI
jgi:large subunit ribosomal protein L21